MSSQGPRVYREPEFRPLAGIDEDINGGDLFAACMALLDRAYFYPGDETRDVLIARAGSARSYDELHNSFLGLAILARAQELRLDRTCMHQLAGLLEDPETLQAADEFLSDCYMFVSKRKSKRLVRGRRRFG